MRRSRRVKNYRTNRPGNVLCKAQVEIVGDRLSLTFTEKVQALAVDEGRATRTDVAALYEAPPALAPDGRRLVVERIEEGALNRFESTELHNVAEFKQCNRTFTITTLLLLIAKCVLQSGQTYVAIAENEREKREREKKESKKDKKRERKRKKRKKEK